MYFFIDPANLTSQTIDDAYGPLSTDATNIYNITSRFQLTDEAKAFACRSGMMIVQQSENDTSLVNLIIRPDNNSDVPIDVEYYVYRGILKNSLIVDDGTNCNIQTYDAATSNDLITRIRQNTLVTDFTCKQIGYDNTLQDIDLIDDFFSYKNIQISPVWVKEGEWIGTFTNVNTHKIGFEIILKSDFNNFNMGYLRAANHLINVTGLTGFEQRLKREEILKFIDPAAFFGMYHSETMDYYASGATNDTETTTENATGTNSDRFIYTKLLENFHTRNKVYVDIRSEKGYSYNFYQNYRVDDDDDDNIQVRPEPGAGELDPQEYHTNNWPILIVESDHNSGNTNKLRLKLRIGANDNPKPILYTKTELRKSLSNNRALTSKYIKTRELIDNDTDPDHTDWTNEFRIFFPNTQYDNDATSSRNYISNYVRLHYFRTKHIVNNTNLSVLQNVHYYDSAFCSIDNPEFSLPDNLDVGYLESANPIYVREPLHHDADHPNYDANYNIEGTGNFELNMINGVYWGDSRVLMYARIEYENSAKVSGKEYLNTYDQDLSSFTQSYGYRLVRERLKYICREYDITGNSGDTKIPGINFFRSDDLADSGRNYKENCMLLGLTIDEMISIKGDTQLSNGHHRHIHLEPLAGNPQEDNNDNRYFAYTIRLQGFDANQHATIVTPQHDGSNIVVYSRDNQFFSSYAFSEDETVTTGENRTEFHIYNDGVIRINDNTDFAILINRDVNGDNTTNIYYKYYDVAYNAENIQDDQITDICNLGFLIANKMNVGVYYNATVHGAATTFTLNHINHHQEAIDAGINNVNADDSFENADGDVWTDGYFDHDRDNIQTYLIRFYENNNQKTFLVHFVAATVNASPLTIDFTYVETLRHYVRPDIAAGVIGALIDIGDDGINSAGFSYGNSSSYPSTRHVNGEAIDTSYEPGNNDQERVANNQPIVNAYHKFGFREILRGTNTHWSSGLNHAVNGGGLHNNHLHSHEFLIRETPIEDDE